MSEPVQPKGIEDYADEQYQARFGENQEIARANRVLRAELGRAQSELANVKDDLGQAERELALYEAEFSAQPKWTKAPKDDKTNYGTLVAFFSDSHYGEVVDPSEMDGFNAYNLAIADQRTGRFFERTTRLARDYMAGVEYEGIVLALGGDLVSGDIHEELEQTNEVSTYEAVLWAVPRLVAGIELLASEFGNVHVVSAPGNHGRNSQKPRSKRRSANNADTLIARLVARQFEGNEAVTFDVPDSFDVSFAVYGSRFAVEHGEQMRFSGTSEIGAYGPVKRGTLRKSRQAQTEGRPFDYNLVGHFHTYIPAASQGLVMNGSLKGYDEYARTGHFLPEPPQQALMLVSPEHGIGMQAPILVGDRKMEGWG